jgi:hypothetical protein
MGDKMDQFFAAVAKRLKELEAERERRYTDKDEVTLPLSESLFRHPLIINSIFWNSSDHLARTECFDWDQANFPRQYINVMRNYTSMQVNRLACRPYKLTNDPAMQVENSKTLVARIVGLRLEPLLQS